MKKLIYLALILSVFLAASCRDNYRAVVLEDNTAVTINTASSVKLKTDDTVWIVPKSNDFWRLDTGEYSMKAVIIE